jgi:hypothetical protein
MIKKRWKRLVIWFAIALSLVIIISGAWNLFSPRLKTIAKFERRDLDLATYDLFDLAVVDANGDRNLDLFTLNHSAQQSLLVNDGDPASTQFTDAYSQWHLDQDYGFAQLEDSDVAPIFDRPGLYIYRQNRLLYLYNHSSNSDPGNPSNAENNGQTWSGKLTLSSAVELENRSTPTSVEETSLPSGATISTVSFSIAPGQRQYIKAFVEIPHQFELDLGEANTPEQLAAQLQQVYIGRDKRSPTSPEFELNWRDRHSFAWSDFNQDGQIDLFVGRGGIVGKMHMLPDKFSDELFIRNAQGFSNVVEQTKLVKNNCPARQTAWVDFNNDQLLDLYVICGRNEEPIHANQLHQQQSDRTFKDVASALGLDFGEDGSFVWLDSDNDGDRDLLISRDNSLWLYRNQLADANTNSQETNPQIQTTTNTDQLTATKTKPASVNSTNSVNTPTVKFEPIAIAENLPAKIMQFAIADFDADGDLDAYGVSKYKQEPNFLLENEQGAFKLIKPDTIGLPSEGLSANWLDYDNDGKTDLFVMPSGIYRQVGDRQFQASQILDYRFPFFDVRTARSNWFDLDNDGDRDLALATQQTPPPIERIRNRWEKPDTSRQWYSTLYVNKLNQPDQQTSRTKYHWLELDLTGNKSNPQAIGTKVLVTVGDRSRLYQVGDAENSYYSQGHYRIYVGLGEHPQADQIKITWADGSQKQLANVPADQLLSVAY